jgi:enoyl-CoA hydratase
VRSGEDIRFERRGALGVVVLDRPKALNALTLPMVQALSAQLCAWKDDPSLGAVVVTAVPGRAFCAGGDVRAVSEAYRQGGVEAIRPFFRDEYRLNWRIKRFPKPYVALLDGVTMGGGFGISVHGRHRIVTENAVLAMPETAIGMFPDVGASYALTHLRDASPAVGMFLGLTGTRLGPGECRQFGLATAYVPSARLEELIGRLAGLPVEELLAVSGDDRGSVARVIGDFDRWDEPQGGLDRKLPLIERCFGEADLDRLLAGLAAESSGWGQGQLENLRAASPFAVRLTFAQLRRGIDLSFDEAMRMEYRLVQRVMQQGDFHEGVRAMLVDKDRNPRWRHARIEDVADDEIEGCFAPFADAAAELRFDWEE